MLRTLYQIISIQVHNAPVSARGENLERVSEVRNFGPLMDVFKGHVL